MHAGISPPFSRRSPPSVQKGVTLIELMIALIVMVIGVVLAVPSFVGTRDRALLKGVAEQHVGLIAERRMESVRTNAVQSFSIADVAVPTGIIASVPTFSSDAGVGTVSFDPRSGLLTDDSVPGRRDLALGDYQLRIEISRMGRAKVCRPATAPAASTTLGYTVC